MRRWWPRPRHPLSRALAAAAAVGLGVAAVPAGRAAPTSAPAPACAGLLADTAVDGRLHRVQLQSTALGGPTEVGVLLPPSFDPTARYPVLYLLHGAGDDDKAWSDVTHGDAETITAGFGGIVVMPDAGHAPEAGWYSDWLSGARRWESYHVGELIPFVDCYYPTEADRAHRAVAGLSMGGFGAISYGARHPDLFGFAATFSGAVDTADGGPAEAASFNLLHSSFGTPDDRVWGPYADYEVLWRDHNPTDLVPNLANTKLVLRTGNGVPAAGDNPASALAEAGVHAMTVALHARLTLAGMDHEFVDGPGVHAWSYWRADLAATLPEIQCFFAGTPGCVPTAPGAGFAYRSAEPSFSVYGWSVSAGPGHVREFLDLSHVTAQTFGAHGGGTYTVTTPALAPGTYSVQTTSNNLARPELQTVATDASGRLTFTLDLGTPHGCQQYTPCARANEATGGPNYWTDAEVSLSRTSA